MSDDDSDLPALKALLGALQGSSDVGDASGLSSIVAGDVKEEDDESKSATSSTSPPPLLPKSPSSSNLQTSLEALQRMVQQQSETIDALSQQIGRLKTEKFNVEKALRQERADKQKFESLASTKSAPSTGVTIDSSDKGGVESGASLAEATALLMAKLPGASKKSTTKAKKKTDSGGVSVGGSPDDAKSALGALFLKKKTPDTGESLGRSRSMTEEDPYAGVFKKYEMILKLTQSIYSAIGRMTQDGIDKDIIAQFKLKHADKLEDSSASAGDAHVSAVSLGLKAKRKIRRATKLKLKRIHWNPIPLRDVSDTIWKGIDDRGVKYQAQHLELNFQVRQRKPKLSSGGKPSKAGLKKRDAKSVERVEFVSKKRSQQVQIGLKGLGFKSNDELRECLMSLDEQKMDADKLAALLDLVPTVEEQTLAEKAATSGEAVDRFGVVEAFFYSLCDFYALKQRLKMWLFKMQFAEIRATLEAQFQCVQKACDKVRGSKLLKKLLAVILAFGNHLNHGSKKGKCYGFELKVLSTMCDMKTMDNSKNFLTYVYEFCDRNKSFQDVLDLHSQLSKLLKNASHIETEVMQNAFLRMEESFREIGDLTQSEDVDEQYDPDDRFIDAMATFHRKEAKKLTSFKMKVNTVTARAKRVLKLFYFGGVEGAEKVENMFKLLSTFVEDFDQCKHLLIKLEKAREKKRLAAEKKRKKAMKSGKVVTGKKVPKAKEHLSALQLAVKRKLAFEEALKGQKSALTKHVHRMSVVAKRGGIGTLPVDRVSNAHRRKVSQIVQTSMLQIEDKRRKAAMVRIASTGEGKATMLSRIVSQGHLRMVSGMTAFVGINEDEELEEDMGEYELDAPPPASDRRLPGRDSKAKPQMYHGTGVAAMSISEGEEEDDFGTDEDFDDIGADDDEGEALPFPSMGAKSIFTKVSSSKKPPPAPPMSPKKRSAPRKSVDPMDLELPETPPRMMPPAPGPPPPLVVTVDEVVSRKDKRQPPSRERLPQTPEGASEKRKKKKGKKKKKKRKKSSASASGGSPRSPRRPRADTGATGALDHGAIADRSGSMLSPKTAATTSRSFSYGSPSYGSQEPDRSSFTVRSTVVPTSMWNSDMQFIATNYYGHYGVYPEWTRDEWSDALRTLQQQRASGGGWTAEQLQRYYTAYGQWPAGYEPRASASYDYASPLGPRSSASYDDRGFG